MHTISFGMRRFHHYKFSISSYAIKCRSILRNANRSPFTSNQRFCNLRTMAENTRSFSYLTGFIVVLIFIGAGLGIGIGIGAGIWKDSSGTDGPELEWFFSQQADKARLSKASPDSNVVFVTLDGLSEKATAITSMPNIVSGTMSHSSLVSALASDPGKNAILVCDKGENKMALPFSIEYGYATDDEVSYLGNIVPFNNGTWSRVDEGKILNESSVLSSFAAGETLEFNSSCYLFIDGWFGDAVDSVKDSISNMKDHPWSAVLGGASMLTGLSPVALNVQAIRYQMEDDPEKKKEIQKEMQATADGGIAAGATAIAAVGGAEVAGAVGGSWIGQAVKETVAEQITEPLAQGAKTAIKGVFSESGKIATRDIVQFAPK